MWVGLGDFDWGQHINNVMSKATKDTGFNTPKLDPGSKGTTVSAYQALVCAQLEYTGPDISSG